MLESTEITQLESSDQIMQETGERRPESVLFGKYELGKLLGCGAFAKVYHARNIQSGQSVAVKVMSKKKIVKGGLITHIKREISIMRRLRHPHIVKLFEVCATKSKIYFVMEFVKGGELFTKVAKGRLMEDLSRRYFQQLISAVRFCHSQGVFHRDLKPENLLLDENENLKVSDFGLSAISNQQHSDGLFHTLCGTPAYVAPEILAKKGYSGDKVDIWSCGVILFVLNAGYLPFNDPNLMVMYRKIYKGEFRCPRWTPPELRRLLSRLLDTNPETRITISEIKEDPWFRKGYREVKPFYDDDFFVSSKFDMPSNSNDQNPTKPTSSNLPRPASLNAFDIISFSSGFDLSGLFEDSGNPDERFISGEQVSAIIEKLEEIAKVVSFSVRKKDSKIELEGKEDGQGGNLAIGAEIFKLTENLVLVEVKKRGGDIREYDEFYKRKLRPALRNLVYDRSAPVYDTE